jgi:hypothetical protein
MGFPRTTTLWGQLNLSVVLLKSLFEIDSHATTISIHGFHAKLMSFERTILSEIGDASGTGFAIGLVLTNECNFACSFCTAIPHALIDLHLMRCGRSVNLGTGENGMHPDFLSIIDSN